MEILWRGDRNIGGETQAERLYGWLSRGERQDAGRDSFQ